MLLTTKENYLSLIMNNNTRHYYSVSYYWRIFNGDTTMKIKYRDLVQLMILHLSISETKAKALLSKAIRENILHKDEMGWSLGFVLI